MELNEYQLRTRGTATYDNSGIPGGGLTYAILALAGEVGELANKWKKQLRAGTQTEPQREVLADELGDCFWYVGAVAHELGFTLEEVAQQNLEKLKQRYAEKKAVG